MNTKKRDPWTTTYRDAPGRGSTVEIAVRLARAFPDRPPTLEFLQEQLGMCRATAYRWRQRWMAAGVLDQPKESQ